MRTFSPRTTTDMFSSATAIRFPRILREFPQTTFSGIPFPRRCGPRRGAASHTWAGLMCAAFPLSSQPGTSAVHSEISYCDQRVSRQCMRNRTTPATSVGSRFRSNQVCLSGSLFTLANVDTPLSLLPRLPFTQIKCSKRRAVATYGHRRRSGHSTSVRAV